MLIGDLSHLGRNGELTITTIEDKVGKVVWRVGHEREDNHIVLMGDDLERLVEQLKYLDEVSGGME